MKTENVVSEELKLRIAEHRLRQVGRLRHIWPKSIRAEVITLFNTGISGTVLSRETGIAGSLIHKWARKAQVKLARDKKAPAKFKELKISSSAVSAVPTMSVTEKLHVRIGPVEVIGFSSSGSVIKFLREYELMVSLR